MTNVIERLFRPVLGLPCWNARPGYGSFMTMEFGEPHLTIREPRVAATAKSERVRKSQARRHVRVHGEWHLWIYCCEWKVYTGDEQIGDSALELSTKEPIERAAAELDGQKLVRVSVDPAQGCSTFYFDLGSRLETAPYEPDTEQWLLYMPSGWVLTYRSDGFYSHHPGSTRPDRFQWFPVLNLPEEPPRRPPIRTYQLRTRRR